MVNAASAAGFVDLCVGFIAIDIFFFLLNPQSGAATVSSAQAPQLGIALELELLVPLGAAAVLFTAAALIYRRLSEAGVPAAGAANGRLSGVAIFALCASAGVLDFFLFVVNPDGDGDHGARARALGLWALRALPGAAAATFFWGMMLVIIGHIRAGGEGGGGAVGGAENGAIQGYVGLLTKIALGAAAGLVFLVTAALLSVKY